ncbi:hypothetical protein SDC9_89865 [bioreactor metagenome]|uniref:Uncharacterized protein n=1 Tax=bioreactor metagenome TaxID=1076179 RepID=A0A644ZQQ4_9ZZZZ
MAYIVGLLLGITPMQGRPRRIGQLVKDFAVEASAGQVRISVAHFHGQPRGKLHFTAQSVAIFILFVFVVIVKA